MWLFFLQNSCHENMLSCFSLFSECVHCACGMVLWVGCTAMFNWWPADSCAAETCPHCIAVGLSVGAPAKGGKVSVWCVENLAGVQRVPMPGNINNYVISVVAWWCNYLMDGLVIKSSRLCLPSVLLHTMTFGKLLIHNVPLSLSCVIWYWTKDRDAMYLVRQT